MYNRNQLTFYLEIYTTLFSSGLLLLFSPIRLDLLLIGFCIDFYYAISYASLKKEKEEEEEEEEEKEKSSVGSLTYTSELNLVVLNLMGDMIE